jgi:hypothetical protein
LPTEKIADVAVENGQPVTSPLVVPKGVDADRFFQASQAKALMRAELTPGGSVTVNCPYCIIYWRKLNPVDVTKFVDTDGNRECVTSCDKGHVLKFRPIPQWREERQKMGLQVKP